MNPLLQQALRLHQNGNLVGAEKIYEVCGLV
jgi:hypothetical protein